jgi:hypothetical protein
MASVALLAGGCSDFLESSMKSDYSPESYFTSEEAAVMAVTGVYNSLYDTRWWIFGDVASDDAVKGGNPGDQVDINAIDDFSATADNGAISEFWRKTYTTIAQANNVIEYIAPMDVPLRGRLVGEARFIRALSYFNLVNIFGKVPYKATPQVTADAIHVGLSEVSDIYGRIEADLRAAIGALPPSYAAEKGRVTKGAAHAMLAKTLLYQEKYADCLSEIGQLDSLKLYRLAGSYADLFRSGAEDSAEVIFGLRFVSTSEVALGNAFSVWMAPSIEGGYYFNAPTQSFVGCFSEKTVDMEDDPRLDATVGRQGKPWFNGLTFDASWSETGFLVRKYSEENPLKLPISQSTVPYHYLRYADVLLMKAEAINELGGGSAAAAASAAAELNKVRRRAGLSSTTAATYADVQRAIRTERRRELGFEAHRFFDLMRWGETDALGSSFTWQGKRSFYFPIPQMEIDANKALSE